MSTLERELAETRKRLEALEAKNAELERQMIVGTDDDDSPMERCEKSGGHRVEPKTWPPPQPTNPLEKPSQAEVCVRCGCHVIVYDRPQKGVTVIKPS